MSGVEEGIVVFVADDELTTDHFIAGQRFITLQYEIERLAPEQP